MYLIIKNHIIKNYQRKDEIKDISNDFKEIKSI